MKYKHLLLSIIIGLLFISCSKNDEDELRNTLSPPDWIIGTWVQTDIGDQEDHTKYVFSHNNVKYFVNDILQINFGTYLETYYDYDLFQVVELENTDEIYEIVKTRSHFGTTTQRTYYKFTKQNETSLLCIVYFSRSSMEDPLKSDLYNKE